MGKIHSSLEYRVKGTERDRRAYTPRGKEKGRGKSPTI